MSTELGVHLFRHGEAKYLQQFVPMREASDLTEKGIGQVQLSAKLLVEHFSNFRDYPIIVASSPTGRTLETARIITDVLGSNGIDVRKKNESTHEGILIFKKLQDQINYSHRAVKILVEGGEIEFNGIKFQVDNNLTNPHGLDIQNYGLSEIEGIPTEVLKSFPDTFVQRVKSIEPQLDAQKRMHNFLQRIFSNDILKPKQHIVMVSHSILTGYLVAKFTENRKQHLEPGEFMSLHRSGDNLHVQIGNLEGDYSFSKDFTNLL